MLFVRSVALASKDRTPRLGTTRMAGDDEWGRAFVAFFDKLPRDDVLSAGVTLYATFLAHVTSFIGGGLTAQLLHSAWPGLATNFENDP
jgi:hypothetical protein